MNGRPGLSLFGRVFAISEKLVSFTRGNTFPKIEKLNTLSLKIKYAFSKKWVHNFGKNGFRLGRFLNNYFQKTCKLKIKNPDFLGPLFHKTEGEKFRKVAIPVPVGWVVAHVVGPAAAMVQDTHTAAESQSELQQPQRRRTIANQRSGPTEFGKHSTPKQETLLRINAI